jgi:cytidylate kinase
MPASIDGIIDRQLRRWEMERTTARTLASERAPAVLAQPIITFSRQHGSNGAAIAGQLAERFQYTLLHRDIIDRMCQSTGYARRLLEALDERSKSQVTNWFDAMLAGKYVDANDYVHALLKTMYSISQLGGAVVVGRGANFIVGPQGGFHVRVVAPREQRIRNVMARRNSSHKDASLEVDQRDHERAEFIRKLFGHSVDDPLAYDVIVNEAETTPNAILGWLEVAARDKFGRLRPLSMSSR